MQVLAVREGVDHLVIWTVIQARLGSTRLPRKVLLPFGDGLLIDQVVKRAGELGPPVCLAIPRGDEELARKCIGREIGRAHV